MKVVNKKEFDSMLDDYPNGGIVFAEYTPDIIRELEVTDGYFGATLVVPLHGEVFDYDFNIDEYKDSDLFMIFDNNDVLQMVQTLTRGLNIKLTDY